MAKETDTPKDEGLQGNEKIEEAILELQKEPTPELLAHVLTVIRRRMKGSNSVKSTFLVSLEQLIHMASETKEISGVIFNPWNRTIMLDHTLLSIIIGEENAGH